MEVAAQAIKKGKAPPQTAQRKSCLIADLVNNDLLNRAP
jgi:hypothetical protein